MRYLCIILSPYGDKYPIAMGGKRLTSIVSLVGIGVVAVPTGLGVSALTKVVRTEDRNGYTN